MYRDEPDAVVLYADSGSALPHVRKFVIDTVKSLGMKLHISTPPISCEDWQDANGLPSDILAVDATPLMSMVVKEKYPAKVVPYPACCGANIWEPMTRGVQEIGADKVIRGSKACDEKVGVPDGFVENGVTYLSPLWTWNDADVFEYLERSGIALPPQYASGCDSLDCWCCTAYMDHHGTSRFAFLKDNYPELYVSAKERLLLVRDTVAQASQKVSYEV